MATTADEDEAEEEAIEEIAVEANDEAVAWVKAERLLSPPTPTLNPLRRTQISLPTILPLR